MRHVLSSALIVGVTALLSVGCGKSPEEKAAEELKAATEKAAEAMAEAGAAAAQQGAAAGTEAAKGMDEFAKAMQGMATAMAGAPAGGKAAEPVSFRDLQTAIPSVNGRTMDNPKGERMTTPVAISQPGFGPAASAMSR